MIYSYSEMERYYEMTNVNRFFIGGHWDEKPLRECVLASDYDLVESQLAEAKEYFSNVRLYSQDEAYNKADEWLKRHYTLT